MEVETLVPVGIATHSEGIILALENKEIEKLEYPFVCTTMADGRQETTRECQYFDIEGVANTIGANLNIHTINFLKNEMADTVICTVSDWGEEEPPRRNRLAEMIGNRLKIISFGDKILGPALFCKVSDLDGIKL